MASKLMQSLERFDNDDKYRKKIINNLYSKEHRTANSRLFDEIRKTDKKGIFKKDPGVVIGYPTGFDPIDYSNGYYSPVIDPKTLELVKRVANIGIMGGSFVMNIGNSNTGKTTFDVQAASNIVLPYELGEVFHLDGEHSSNISRIAQLNHFTSKQIDDKYTMMDLVYIEDIYKFIIRLAAIKMASSEYRYNTGLVDVFGREIIGIQPTCIIADAIPSFQTKEIGTGDTPEEDEGKKKKLNDDMSGQSYNMRKAIAYSAFYQQLRPVLYRANIIFFGINHIKEKPDMGFTKTQAKIQYLKPNESIPGGSAPIYLSQTMFRFIYGGKFTVEKNGFDGFLVKTQSLKSKTNRSDRTVNLIFDYETGFDPVLTLLKLADDSGLVAGRNPYSYFVGNPDVKFSTKNFRSEIDKKPSIKEILIDITRPVLNKMLEIGNLEDEEDPSDFSNRLDNAYSISDEMIDSEAML